MIPALAQALSDAELLLIHAMREGLDVPQAVIDSLVQTQTLFEQQGIRDVHEAQFWTAFGTLSKLVAPVSVHSLRATMDSHATPPPVNRFLRWFRWGDHTHSLARRAVMSYTIMTMSTLVFLLLIQIYWLFGVSVVDDIKELRDAAVANKAQATATRLLRDQGLAAGWKTGRSENDLKGEIKLLDDIAKTKELGIESSYDMLATWSSPWERMWQVKGSCQNGEEDDLGKMALCENMARLQASKVVLENLQRYALPLLYGLLGACVFTLRTLADKIRARSYSESSNIDFRIRLCLGTLGGLVSAWFLLPGNPESISGSISPFALAFLAGYSIELVFTAMDRIIGAFTKPGGKT